MIKPPCILTIAGSDSGGGAGIQADLKTIMALGGFGLSVITALTAQNGLEVTGIHTPEPDFIALQLKTVCEGFPIKAIKTGVLHSSSVIMAIKNTLNTQNVPLVIDPVCVSQSGQQLLETTAIETLQKIIIPMATLITPNKPEAEILSGIKIHTEQDIYSAGEKLIDMGAKAVLIKGGHFDAKEKTYTDWYIEPKSKPLALSQPVVETNNTHGTGCTLSAAIATYLGLGLALHKAILQAQKYLNDCLKYSYTPGKGFGPPNHAAWIKQNIINHTP